MKTRSQALGFFVEAAAAAFGEYAQDARSRRLVAEAFRGLETPTRPASGPGQRLPVCARLEEALAVAAAAGPSLRRMVDAFRALEPSLAWRRRSFDETASPNFYDGHANTMIVGPGGHEERGDVWLGATLMAPDVRYPDHAHAPEEVYLVLSAGEFKQGNSRWFSPGVGGSFYNKPCIRHAMRSLDRPFLAFWALRSDAPASAVG